MVLLSEPVNIIPGENESLEILQTLARPPLEPPLKFSANSIHTIPDKIQHPDTIGDYKTTRPCLLTHKNSTYSTFWSTKKPGKDNNTGNFWKEKL